MTSRPWTDYEDRVLRHLYAHQPNEVIGKHLGRSRKAVGLRARKLGLRKPEYMNTGCFQKGQTPWNKGMNYVAGGRSGLKRFKPGNRPHTWVPVGTEVTDKEGYLKRKIRDDAPKGQSRKNWKYVHVLLWEEHHGPVPRGHIVVFRNKDKTDIRIENLECITKRENMQRNTAQRYGPEVFQVIQLRGALNRKIRNMERKHEEQDHRPA